MTVEVKQEYQWNQNWANAITHTDIYKIVQELRDIQEVRGDISPKYVVESAKNKKSALHHYFTWDNDLAADKWRLQQAAKLLRSIEVRVIKDGETKTIRVFEISSPQTGLGNESKYVSFDSSSSSSSSRVKTICSGDLVRIINRLDSFPEYKVVVSWLKKTATLLNSIEPKESTETKEEVKQPLTVVA